MNEIRSLRIRETYTSLPVRKTLGPEKETTEAI